MNYRIIMILLLLTASSCYAGQDNPNNIWLSYSQDANDTIAKAMLLTLELGEDDQLILGAAQTVSVYNQYNLSTNDYSVTYSTFRLSPWSVDLGYRYWGKDQELEIRTASLTPTWNGELWSLGLNLEQRTITFYSRQFLSGTYSRDLDSTGFGPEINFADGNWSWSLTAMDYSYSKDLSNLNLARVLVILGARTFLHATTLTDWYAMTQLNYDFDKFAMGAKYVHSISAIDQAPTDSASLLFDFDLSQRTTLSLEAGQVYNPSIDATNFAVLSLSVDF